LCTGHGRIEGRCWCVEHRYPRLSPSLSHTHSRSLSLAISLSLSLARSRSLSLAFALLLSVSLSPYLFLCRDFVGHSRGRAEHRGATHHPEGNPGTNLQSISYRCYLSEVASVWELTKENIVLPLGCLQGGVFFCRILTTFPLSYP
jgi:hypothetical protein